MKCKPVKSLRELRAAWPFWYLATAYSKYPGGQEAAYDVAVEAKGVFLLSGVPVFSPITELHHAAQRTEGIDPLDGPFWERRLMPFVQISYGLIVVKMLGWDESIGIAKEVDEFVMAGKPVLYLEWPA